LITAVHFVNAFGVGDTGADICSGTSCIEIRPCLAQTPTEIKRIVRGKRGIAGESADRYGNDADPCFHGHVCFSYITKKFCCPNFDPKKIAGGDPAM
jgi:hypothetical protein